MQIMLSLDPQESLDIKQLLQQLKGRLTNIKIGHILASQNIETHQILLRNFDLFLDFKFFDIPNTVKNSITNYKKKFPSLKYYTIHGTADENMIKTCIDCDVATPLSVIALSSNASSNNDLTFMFQVERNIKLGITHFVCPPNQVENMRKAFGATLVLFVPGIRNSTHQSNDHLSTIDLQKAKILNVDFAIIGRPILESEKPLEVLQEFMKY